MRSLRYLIVLPLLSLSACLYSNVRAPFSYRTATPSEVKSDPSDPIVTAEACTRSVFWLFAWGDASYAAVTSKALGEKRDGLLYDVKFDLKARSFLLGLYTRACTVLTGKVAKP